MAWRKVAMLDIVMEMMTDAATVGTMACLKADEWAEKKVGPKAGEWAGVWVDAWAVLLVELKAYAMAALLVVMKAGGTVACLADQMVWTTAEMMVEKLVDMLDGLMVAMTVS